MRKAAVSSAATPPASANSAAAMGSSGASHAPSLWNREGGIERESGRYMGGEREGGDGEGEIVREGERERVRREG